MIRYLEKETTKFISVLSEILREDVRFKYDYIDSIKFVLEACDHNTKIVVKMKKDALMTEGILRDLIVLSKSESEYRSIMKKKVKSMLDGMCSALGIEE